MKRLLITATLIAFPLTAQAYDFMLPKHSVVCGSLASLKKAERAVVTDDQEWFVRSKDCVITGAAFRRERVECEGSYCLIRIWAGGQSSLAYTFRRHMSN